MQHGAPALLEPCGVPFRVARRSDDHWNLKINAGLQVLGNVRVEHRDVNRKRLVGGRFEQVELLAKLFGIHTA